MNIRTIVVVFLYFVAILALSTLLFWWLGRDEGPAGNRGAPPANGPGPGRMVESVDQPPAARPEPVPPGAANRAARHAADAAARQITGPRLTVLDGRTGRPIPGAQLVMLDTADLPWLQVRTENPDVLLATHGQRCTCDPDGRVTVPWPTGEWLIEARHRRLWNRKIFAVDTATALTLSLFPVNDPPSLQVRVVDAQKQPRPDVDVVLYDRTSQVVRHTARSRAPDGVAVFRLPRADVDTLLARGGVDVALDVAGRPEVHTSFTAWPEGPVELTLPAGTGQLTLLIQGPDGQPWTGPAHARIRFEHGPGWIERYQPARKGLICRPFVRPGVRFHVQLFLHEGIPVGPEHSVDGPIQAGEEARHVLVIGRNQAVLQGVAFSPEGKRLALPATLELRLAHDREGVRFLSPPVQVHPDAKGRVALPVQDWPFRELRVRWIRAGRVRAEGSVALHGPYRPGVHQLLGARLKSVPLLVAGVVQDQAGNPLPRATVELHRKDRPGRASEATVLTSPDGRFAFWDASSGEPISLVARREPGGPVTPSVVKEDVKPGENGVVLMLTCPGTLAGSVKLPDGLPADLLLEAAALAPDGSIAGSPGLVAADGAFFLGPVPGNAVQVVIRRAGGSRALARVADVAVRPGVVHRDPRLSCIDLTGQLRVVEILVTGSGDRPLDGATVEEIGMPDSCVLTDDQGRGQLVLDRPAADLVVRAPGHRLTRVEGVGQDRTVQLGPGLPVEIRFHPLPVLPPGLLDLVVVAPPEPTAGEPPVCRPDPVRTSLPPRPGPLYLMLEAPGSYSITLHLGDETIHLPEALTVADQSTLQRFTVSLPAEKVAAALESAVKIEK